MKKTPLIRFHSLEIVVDVKITSSKPEFGGGEGTEKYITQDNLITTREYDCLTDLGKMMNGLVPLLLIAPRSPRLFLSVYHKEAPAGSP